ncbi:hypothetical protein U0070_004181 [Myodes glareolus]|uniref:Uncharacterized protein n=1 Tax=Myodes glareolus TaxID=447135 RepID=A0AAW0HP83_MYOGA
MRGNPDVLEYYKKPLRIINLNFCEQASSGLTFNTKELLDSFGFDIQTSEHTFYLVAKTKASMNNHTEGSLIESETDNEDAYTFRTPSNILCREFGDLLVDNMDVPTIRLSAYQISRIFTLEKNRNAMTVASHSSPTLAPQAKSVRNILVGKPSAKTSNQQKIASP